MEDQRLCKVMLKRREKEYSGFQFAGDSRCNSMRSIDIVLPENVVFDKGV